ncbi:MAG: hypothetical protein Aurels2KO_54440 [Aureliella sp.]
MNYVAVGARGLWKCLLIIWAGPNTFVALLIAVANCATGGRLRLRRGALESFGGVVAKGIRRFPTGPQTAGVTLGHMIFGQTARGLEAVTNHERVHVKQYERLGPFFLPTYFFLSARAWWRGQDPYMDNPLEIEAYKVKG